jgi:hypothetical protein
MGHGRNGEVIFHEPDGRPTNHEGAQRKTLRDSPSCTFVPFVVKSPFSRY